MPHERCEAGHLELVAAALGAAGVAPPPGWQVVHAHRGLHDGRPVTVVRHQPHGPRTLLGVHTTAVVDDQGVLLGWTNLTLQAAGRPHPQPATAQQAAFNWLARFAADHATGLVVQWVQPHDETVLDPSGDSHTILGTKVKTRHLDGRYTWVVLGDGPGILTYERNVRWDAAAGRRGTEMWLHDAWVAACEGSGPQPPAPYALARTPSRTG
jgi:hypothetical protein